MTGLFRTTLFFFLPVFLGLILYHSWQVDPDALRERRIAFLAPYESAIDSSKELATEMLQESPASRSAPLPASLRSAGIVLVEGIRDETPVIRMVSPMLSDHPSWRMIPDADAAPSFLTGFRFSAGKRSIPCFLIETTIYDANGNPVALNIYIREEEGSSHEDTI